MVWSGYLHCGNLLIGPVSVSALQKKLLKAKRTTKTWRSQVWCEQKNGFKKCLFYFFVSCLIFVLFCGWEKCLFRGAVDWVTKSFSKLCGKRQSRDCLFSCQFRGRKCGLSFLRKHATHLRCWGKQLSRVTFQRPENVLFRIIISRGICWSVMTCLISN